MEWKTCTNDKGWKRYFTQVGNRKLRAYDNIDGYVCWHVYDGDTEIGHGKSASVDEAKVAAEQCANNS